jgi:hypothetical protein
MAHHWRTNDILELFVVPDSFQCVAKDVGVAVRSKQFRDDRVSNDAYSIGMLIEIVIEMGEGRENKTDK